MRANRRLFNRLTGADVLAEDMLFATLDPTMRAIALPGVEKAILSDTVGFISDLPIQLVAAFRATLEEIAAADLIVHVRDMAEPMRDEQRKEVLKVLAELDIKTGELADGEGEAVPLIEAWNKSDLLTGEQLEALTDAALATNEAVMVSAVTGDGVETLRQRIGAMLTEDAKTYSFDIPATDGARIAWLHRAGRVIDERTVGVGAPVQRIEVRLDRKARGQFDQL